MGHSAVLPTHEYMFELFSRGVLSEEEATMPAILFKAPGVCAGDRTGPDAVVSIQFPCEEVKQDCRYVCD
eukprot:scaffold748_cov118-Amphora_coffeaeformis.AAC.1